MEILERDILKCVKHDKLFQEKCVCVRGGGAGGEREKGHKCLVVVCVTEKERGCGVVSKIAGGLCFQQVMSHEKSELNLKKLLITKISN